MKVEVVFVASVLASQMLACGDDLGGGGSGGSGGSAQGGEAAGGQAEGGQAMGGQAQGAAAEGGAGGAGPCVPSETGSGDDVDCMAYCAAVVATDCPNGPPTVVACARLCEDLKSRCPGYDNLVDCAGAAPEYACDANGMVVTVGCEAVFESCVVPCLGG